MEPNYRTELNPHAPKLNDTLCGTDNMIGRGEHSMTFVKRYKRDKDGELEKQLLIFASYQKLVNESR